MLVGVYKSRNHGTAATVNNSCASGIECFRRDCDYSIAFNEHIGIFDSLLIHTIKNVNVGKQKPGNFVLSCRG